MIEQEGFCYSDDYIPKHDGFYIKGYWNSEKFFAPYKNQIIKDFTFPELDEQHNIVISDIIANENSVSLHVRRGDFVNNSMCGNICSENYYHNAIKYIQENIESPSFYIFSNDIDWCRNNLSRYFKDSPVTYVTENVADKSYRDMQLMSLCKHNIVANSGFSWWGAYLNLNPNKIVLAPNRWWNSDDGHQKDVIPDEWIQLPIL